MIKPKIFAHLISSRLIGSSKQQLNNPILHNFAATTDNSGQTYQHILHRTKSALHNRICP